LRHAVILSHPDPKSFNASAAETYAAAVRELGQTAEVHDLYARTFDPRLPAHEIPWRPDFAPAPEVAAERAWIADADVLVFVYPLWFNAPPAMLKGYVERVLGMGFAYATDAGGTRPLLTSKCLISITTSGAPSAWVQESGALERLRAGFDDHLGAVCGLAVLDHLHIGGVTPGMRDDAAKELLDRVSRMARRHFAPAAADA